MSLPPVQFASPPRFGAGGKRPKISGRRAWRLPLILPLLTAAARFVFAVRPAGRAVPILAYASTRRRVIEPPRAAP